MLLLLLACAGKPDDTATIDRDGDGVPDTSDCAPDDPASGAPPRLYVDADRDGYGVDDTMERVCPGTPGYAEAGGDCDDRAASVYPGAPEVWYDGADEDCAGDSDFDQDHDGLDRPADCDDLDPAIPAAAEDCATEADDDCDGTANEIDARGCVALYVDEDGDGYGTGGAICQCEPEGDVRATVGGDCDDTEGARFPGAFERCDDRQNGCAGAWRKEDELGVVTLTAADGTVSDVSAAWAAGRASAPTSLVLPAEGAIDVCPAIWFVRLSSPGGGAGALLRGHPAAGTVTLDGSSGRVLTLSDPAAPRFSLSDVQIQGGYADVGGAVLAEDVHLTLERVVVVGSLATTAGGGVYATGGSLSLVDTRITGNVAPAGAGLYLYDTSLVASGAIDLNVADRAGGAYGGGLVWLGMTGATLTIDGLSMTDNAASSARGEAWSGGMYVEEQAGAPVSITNLSLDRNLAGSSNAAAMAGGAYLRISTGALLLADVTADGNSAVGTGPSYAGGINVYADNPAGVVDLQRLTLTNNVVLGDDGSSGGGLAITVASSESSLTEVSLSGNSVASSTGTASGSGGGLTLASIGSAVRLDGVVARSNAAGTGAGALITTSSGAPVSVSASIFDDNTTGGGLMYVPYDAASTLELSGTSCAGNDSIGLWVYAGTGGQANLTFTGRSGADTDLDGNQFGLALSCGEVGGACNVTAPSLDFAASRGRNTQCDVYYDGSCAARLGDDIALTCAMSGSAVSCSW